MCSSHSLDLIILNHLMLDDLFLFHPRSENQSRTLLKRTRPRASCHYALPSHPCRKPLEVASNVVGLLKARSNTWRLTA